MVNGSEKYFIQLAVLLYSRYLSNFGSKKLFAGTLAVLTLVLLWCLVCSADTPSASLHLAPSLSLHSTKGAVFVQIHVLAYILTRSVHVPLTSLDATLFPTNPFSSKALMYHGINPALLNSTLPPIFIARLTALACAAASGPLGENQSMLSMRTAMVRASGCMRAKTSASSSVWMRRLSRA